MPPTIAPQYKALGALAVTFAMHGHARADEAPTSALSPTLAELTRPSSSFEFGLGALSGVGFAAGGPEGLRHQGGFGIVGFDLRGSQYSFGNDLDDKIRWRLTGSNLGLNSRSLAGEYGQQGTYRLTFGVEGMPRLDSDSYQSPLLGAGSSMLSLPIGFVQGAVTGAMTTLDASMRRIDVEATRRRADIGVSYWLTPEWQLRVGFRNDERSGTRIRGAEFGSNGGNPRGMLLPEPIDSSTQLIDASLDFGGDGQQFTLSYHGSLFRNRVDALTWQNPYANTPWVGGATGLPLNFALPNGRLGVAPDNQFHQLSASGLYELSNSSRLTLVASFSRMTQNESFLPYTVNPGLTSTALPQTSLNGLVQNTFLNAKLSLRPMRNLSVQASLRVDHRDNKTPQAEYIYVGGDIQLQPAVGSNSDRIRTNLPRSRRQHQLLVDIDYRIMPGTSLKAGWERNHIRRTFAEVETQVENTYRLDLRQSSTGPWTANAGLSYVERHGSQYLYNLPFLASYTSAAFQSALAADNSCTVLIDCVRNGPLLQQKFYLADRNRGSMRLQMGYTPQAPVSLQGRLELHRDRYPNSYYGLYGANNWSAAADLGYSFSDAVSATLFAAMEKQRSRARTRQVASTNTAVPTTAEADWENSFADTSTTFGMGVKHAGLLGGRLTLSAEALTVRARTPITTTVGNAVVAAQNPAKALPDQTSRSTDIKLAAWYAMDRQTTLRLHYSYRRLRSSNWAYQEVDAATITNLIGTLEVPPRYSLHGVGVSYVYVFR